MQKNSCWQPTATITALRQRADILQRIRAFFYARDVYEVETPLMCHASVTDPFIESIPAIYQAHPGEQPQTYYLQTSPEYAMKRLLAAESGSIFQICKAFRQGETGRWHNPEFTMLEWYRVGFNQMQLIDEVDELLQTILQTLPADKITYTTLFANELDIDVHRISTEELKNVAASHQIIVQDEINDRETWLNLLMTHHIEPRLGREKPCVIYNYPATQAALARINVDEPNTAARFEFFFKGMELANGFHELQNADEQRKRFEENNLKRAALQLPVMPIDELLLAALKNGLPDCSGVALGIDRLVMLTQGASALQAAIAFPVQQA